MAFRDGNAIKFGQLGFIQITINRCCDQNAVTINKARQLRSIRRNFLLSNSLIPDPAVAVFRNRRINRSHDSTRRNMNMDGERGVVLTQSAIVWTNLGRPPPFWLIVTALDLKWYLPVNMAQPCYVTQWSCMGDGGVLFIWNICQ